MINPKKVIEIASKWQNAASLKKRPRNSRRGIYLSSINNEDSGSGFGEHKCKLKVAQKGHFVVYSIDKKRFVVPLYYLNHNIFKELFKMSEEEFGLPATGPIIMPCDAVSMEYIISLVKRHANSSNQESFFTMVAHRRSLINQNHLMMSNQQILLPRL